MEARTFKIGGVHPPQDKTAPADHIITVELPMSVTIPLKQHLGAEATPLVKKGDKVTRGQKIGEACGKISAPVHASISGTVTAIATAPSPQGRPMLSVTITADEAEHQADEEARRAPAHPIDYSRLTPEEVAATIANSGVVGMGGATFPTAVKVTPPPGMKADVLIINACECEPRLTCDDALMRAKSTEIVEGIKILMYTARVDKAVIGIEDNKPQAIAAMRAAAKGHDGISVQPLKTKYPQGGEKQLITAITGREVPSGGLPIQAGAIVQNVGTAWAVYKAIALGMPLIERVVTIDQCGNYLAPIGMRISDLPAQPATTYEVADVVAGGPMMGQSAVTLDAPVTKGFSGISVVRPLPFSPDPCIRCGQCMDACPMGLESYLISTYGRLGKTEEAALAGAMDCIECGSCSYACPSARPVLDYIRLAKMKIRSMKK